MVGGGVGGRDGDGGGAGAVVVRKVLKVEEKGAHRLPLPLSSMRCKLSYVRLGYARLSYVRLEACIILT